MNGRINYQTYDRRERIDTIELVIEKCSNEGLPATKHGLFEFATERWGVTPRKLLEYLTDLTMRKIIVVEGDECWTIKRWKKIEKARSLDFNKMTDIING